MKVTQEKLPASQVGLEIEITPEMTTKTYNQVIENFNRAANIPGFRKGKVPRQILVQRLGVARIKAAALEELIQDGIEQAVKQTEIKAIGQPQLRTSFEELIGNYEPGKPLTFSAAVDVPPEVQLKQYTDLHVQAEEVKFDPEKVTQVLEENRQERATLIPVEGRPAQIGDVAVVDFKGTLVPLADSETTEKEPIPGGEAEDFEVELQEDRFIPGFIAGIIGMNAGETKEISAQFPDPYANSELAGRGAEFTVTLKDIKEKELPELNDDFAQEVSEFETLAEFQASIEQRFQKEALDQTKVNKHQAISDALFKQVEVELPETLIMQEVDAMLTQTAVQLSRQGMDVRKLFTQEIIASWRDRSRPEAEERITRSLALLEVGKRESIEVPQAEIDARVQELMEQYTGQDIDTDRLLSVVQEELLTEKIMDWLEAHSTVELVPEGSLNPEPEDEAVEDSASVLLEDAPAIEVSASAVPEDVPAIEGAEVSATPDEPSESAS